MISAKIINHNQGIKLRKKMNLNLPDFKYVIKQYPKNWLYDLVRIFLVSIFGIRIFLHKLFV